MCVLIIDTAGRITAASGAAAFAGTATATGRTFHDLVAPEFTRLISDALTAALAGSAQIVHFRSRDQPEMWQGTLAMLPADHSGTAVAAFIRRAPPASLQKDQLIARGVRSVAHDLNNVLTVIVGLNGLMASGDDERRELYTSEIGKAADQATRLAAELLAFGRKASPEVRVFGVNPLLLELQPLLRRMIPPHFELVTHVSDRVDPIRVDRAVVETMIIDLIVSVIQTMPEGGQLALRSYAELITPAKAETLHVESAKYTVWETSAVGARADLLDVPATVHAAAVDSGAFLTVERQAGSATLRVFFRSADRGDSHAPLA